MGNRHKGAFVTLGIVGTAVAATWLWTVIAAAGDRNRGDTANPRGAGMKVAAEVQKPEVIVVRVHHDMCPYCQKLDPEYAKLSRDEAADSVLFVTLDMSSPGTQKQAALLVGALGLGDLWTGDLSNVATVSFVEGKSRRTISTIRAMNVDAQALRDAMLKALATMRR